MDKHEQAKQDYLNGMKYKDIATKYDVSLNTVKSWKKRHGWERGAPPEKSVHTKRKKVAHKVVDELVDNDDLTDKQKAFCLYYLQRFNATWAYMKAYGVNYATASANGSRLLGNAKVQTQLSELKNSIADDLHLTAVDIAREYAKQAFSDVGDYVNYSSKEEPIMKYDHPLRDEDGNVLTYDHHRVQAKPQDEVDTSLIKSVRIERGEFIFELYDKQVAQSNLMKYFSDNQVSQSRVAKAQADAEVSKAKASLLSGEDEDNREAKNDMYLDGLKELLGDDNSENEGTETDDAEHDADS